MVNAIRLGLPAQDMKEEYEAGNLYDELEIDNFRIVEVEDEAGIV
jgi:hypothetical protein